MILFYIIPMQHDGEFNYHKRLLKVGRKLIRERELRESIEECDRTIEALYHKQDQLSKRYSTAIFPTKEAEIEASHTLSNENREIYHLLKWHASDKRMFTLQLHGLTE